MRLLIFSSLFLLLLLPGCEQKPQDDAKPATSTVTPAEPQTEKQTSAEAAVGLFNQPTTPELYELPSEAIPSWRIVNTEKKPALVIFSFDPFLTPIDPSLASQAKDLALSGTLEGFLKHGSFNTAEPIILANQAVSAAISADLFSKIYWIIPSKVRPDQLELELFQKQMREKQILTADEAAALSLNNGVYSGLVRGIPFEAIHHQQFSEIPEPAVLHIDLSFFRGLYDNEVKTPLYTLLRNLVDQLRLFSWDPLVTTLSYSTLEGSVALDVRFVITNLAELMINPELLDAEMPKEWGIRSEALYAADMYSESKKDELSKDIINAAPNSAPANYDRFQALFMGKMLNESLLSLKRAVEIDPGYGAAYLQLAQMAVKEGQNDITLQLLNEAEKLFPYYPFIALQKVHLLLNKGEQEQALDILDTLPDSWSPLYHEDIPDIIAELRQSISAEKPMTTEKE